MLQGFTNALQKGMDYVQSHTPEEIAKRKQKNIK
jgi:NitT/TauT family transport system substrate-binding protein